MSILFEATPELIAPFAGAGMPDFNWLMSVLVVIFIAFVWLVIGYVIAAAVELVLKKMFRRAKIEDVLAEHGLSGALMGFTLSGIITSIIKWMIFLAFVALAVNKLELAIIPSGTPVLTSKIEDFGRFLIGLLKGIIVLVIGLLMADLVATRVKEGIKFHGKTVGLALKLIIIYFTVVIVLSIPEYSLDTSLLISVFESLAFGVSLGIAGAITLAFGLGLKDTVANIAKKREKEIEHVFVGSEE